MLGFFSLNQSVNFYLSAKKKNKYAKKKYRVRTCLHILFSLNINKEKAEKYFFIAKQHDNKFHYKRIKNKQTNIVTMDEGKVGVCCPVDDVKQRKQVIDEENETTNSEI